MPWRLTLLTLAACAQPAVDSRIAQVVFGDDDRREPHEAEALFAAIAREQVAVRVVDWAVDLSDPELPRSAAWLVLLLAWMRIRRAQGLARSTRSLPACLAR